MQQFVIMAYDATDEKAMERRLAAREEHTKAMTLARENGNMLCGAALLDDNGKMIGSNILVNFSSRAELDAWLASEPYVKGKVWDKITVTPARLGDSFKDLIRG
ncbi:MAG: YciI family protein [Rickettsiales bacterium]